MISSNSIIKIKEEEDLLIPLFKEYTKKVYYNMHSHKSGKIQRQRENFSTAREEQELPNRGVLVR